MLPTDVPGASIRACAKGTYNAHWRQFGQMISSYGLGSSIIRLGWEFNGNWYPWAATDPTAWAECWRQAVTSAWSTAPRLRWDWNVNRGVSSALADPTRAYPGNRYVSMIGIDSYDSGRLWSAPEAGISSLTASKGSTTGSRSRKHTARSCPCRSGEASGTAGLPAEMTRDTYET